MKNELCFINLSKLKDEIKNFKYVNDSDVKDLINAFAGYTVASGNFQQIKITFTVVNWSDFATK